MRDRLSFFLGIFISYSNVCAQYDGGTVIYSNNDSTIIQKNYKIVDFDGDNYVDIILIKEGNLNQLSWYKGDGSGNFSKQANLLEIQDYKTGKEIFYADMNGDKTNDLVFKNSDSGFTILLNDGQGNITSKIDYNLVKEDTIYIDLKEIADMDRDGDMDYIFYENNDSAYLSIGYNDGSGLPSDYSYINKEGNNIILQLEAVDLDSDGDFDFVANGIQIDTTNSSLNFNKFINVYENLEGNNFVVNNKIDEYNFFQFHIQDINNDGDPEWLIESIILEYLGDVVHPARAMYTFPFHVLDYDVEKEVFFTLETYDSWLHGYTFELDPILFSLYDVAFQIQFGNQNDDDNLDILSVNVLQGKLLWLLGDGKGDFEIDQTQIVHTSSEYSNNIPTLRVADVDNDDDLDVFVLLNTGISSTLTLFKNEAPVSTEDIYFDYNELEIIPNPSPGNSHIQLELPQSQNPINLTYNIFTIKGEKIKSGIYKDESIFIPGLANGMYILEILSDDKRYFKKLMIR